MTMVCVWGLISCAACAQDRGNLTHIKSVEGMEGYTILTREAQEPEKLIYETTNVQTQPVVAADAQPPVESRKAAAESTSTAKEAAPQNLRRQRIPLRRNRQLLLKQQTRFPNILQN